MKVDQTVSRREQPNLRNQGHMYRDSNPEIVYRSCMWWAKTESDRENKPLEDRIKWTRAFRMGLYDTEMHPHCIQFSKNATMGALSFFSGRAAPQGSGVEESDDTDPVPAADLPADKKQLLKEQAMWRDYRQRAVLFETSNAATLLAFKERLHDAHKSEIQQFMMQSYITGIAGSFMESVSFAHDNAAALLNQHPASSMEDLLRLSWVATPFLGPQASTSRDVLLQAAVAEILRYPKTTLWLLLLPNCPMEGRVSNHVNGMDWEDEVEKHVAFYKVGVANALAANPSIRSVRIHGSFVEDEAWTERTHRPYEMIAMLSRLQKTPAGGVQESAKVRYESVWQDSFLLKRKTQPAVETLPEAERLDWCAEGLLCVETLPDSHASLLYQSGVPLCKTTLQNLMKGCSFKATQKLQLRDLCPRDDCLGRALMGIQQREESRSPQVQYVAAVWHQEPAANLAIANNISDSLFSRLMSAVKAETFKCKSDAVKNVGRPPHVEATHRPTFHEANYTVCHPTDGGTYILQIRQEIYDKYVSSTRAKAEWEALARVHNEEFNKECNPWRGNRRAAPTPVGVQESGSREVELAVQESARRQELLNAGAHVVPAEDGKFEYLISADGQELYLWGVQDTAITRAKAMFCVRGGFKWGAPAAHIMAVPTNQWISASLDSSSVVLSQFVQEMPLGVQEFEQEPRPLGALLAELERAGHVRITMHKHTYTRDAESPHGYKVTAGESLCLVPKTNNDGAPDLLQMSNWLDFGKLKACSSLEMLHQITFDKELNKLTPDVPGVFPKTPIRVRAATLYSVF